LARVNTADGIDDADAIRRDGGLAECVDFASSAHHTPTTSAGPPT
jgi:hypothetical protein